METKQIWFVPLNCGLVARVMLDIGLLNRIRVVQDMNFIIKKEDIKIVKKP